MSPSSAFRVASLTFLLSTAPLLTPCAMSATPTKTDGGQNAFVVLRGAVDGLKDVKKVGYAISRTHDPLTDADDREYSPAEMAQLVDENRTVLSEARRALTLPYTPPPVHDLSDKFPYFAKFRAIARLFALDAKVKEANGQWAAALDSRLDAVALGEKVQSHTVMIGSLVGAACELIGLRPSWTNVDHLSAEESKTEARRLEALIAGHPPFAETQANEKRVGYNSLPILYRTKDPVALFDADNPDFSDDERQFLKQAFAELHRVGVAAAQRDYQTASAIAVQRDSGAWKATGNEQAPGRLMITRVLLSTYTPKIRFKILLVETQARLLLTQLALRAYHDDNGSYPDTLQALVPAYLKAIPADLFSASDTLKYGLMGNSPLVYSIGPDGVDDAGQAIVSPDEKDEVKRHFPDMDSTGDIVAGINI